MQPARSVVLTIRRFRTVSIAALVLATAAASASAQTPGSAAPSGGPAAATGDPYTLSTDPVSGEKLPPKPVQRVHEGRRLAFASEDTAKKFEAEPAKYLGALDQAMASAQARYYPLTDCVVSGHAAAGEPIEIVKGNRLFRLCCTDCVPILEKDQAKYFAKLDAAVIAAQKKDYALDSCPITGKKLGSMGEPLDVVAGNRLVRLCCKGCVKKLNEEMPAAMAKLDAASKK